MLNKHKKKVVWIFFHTFACFFDKIDFYFIIIN